MKRKIIKINSELCNGCGLCAKACHEGAIGMVDGKAVLLREDYCDGLGDCLPVCPTGAITFEEREAAAYDEAAVLQAQKAKQAQSPLPCGCPGMNAKAIRRVPDIAEQETQNTVHETQNAAHEMPSALSQWPVQIKLVPPHAPYLQGAKLLIAADCAAYAYANFHKRFIKGHITLIGCPKLDSGDYADKLTEILTLNDIKKVTVVRMEVPCCAGIAHAVQTALQRSGKTIPWQIITISVDGSVLED